MQNFESEKFANKICAKNAQSCAKLEKRPKITQKRPTNFSKTRGKKQKLAQL